MTSYALRIALVSAALTALSVASAAGSETGEPDWLADCGGTYDLCGFVDRDRQEIQIPRQFERAFAFSEGLAGVRIEGKYGYIDSTGRIVIEPKFDLVGAFRNGHAEALVGEHVGVIDRSGSFVLPPEYARAIPFGKTAALVQSGRWKSGVIRGYERLATDHLINDETPFTLIDLGTRRILEERVRIEEFDFHTYVWAKRTADELFGLLAPDGTWKLQPTYTQVHKLRNERAIVCLSDEADTVPANSSVRCGSLDENGDQALPMMPYRVTSYQDGIYRAFVEPRKVGISNEAGALYDRRLSVIFTEPGAVIEVLENGVWVGVTGEGKIVKTPENDRMLLGCRAGIRYRARPGGMDVIKGDRLTAPSVLNPSRSKDCDTPRLVTLDDKIGFIDASGRLLFDPPYFERAYPFSEGHAGVRIGGKWGIVNTSGHFTVNPRYSELRPAGKDTFAVKFDNERLTVNIHGERVPKPVQPDPRRAALTCRDDGGTIVGKSVDGQMLWGLADMDGRVLVEPKYRAIFCFQAGLAWVPFDDRKQWCPIDRNEKIRTNIACETVPWGIGGYHSGPERILDDPYENGVHWMRATFDYGRGVREKPPRTVSNNQF